MVGIFPNEAAVIRLVGAVLRAARRVAGQALLQCRLSGEAGEKGRDGRAAGVGSGLEGGAEPREAIYTLDRTHTHEMAPTEDYRIQAGSIRRAAYIGSSRLSLTRRNRARFLLSRRLRSPGSPQSFEKPGIVQGL